MATEFPAPDIEDHDARIIVALARDFTMQTRHEIPQLWNAFFQTDFDVAGRVPGAMYGVSFDLRPDGTFRYGVGVEAQDPKDLPEGACVITLAQATYAIFRHRSSVSEIPALFDHIYQNWLPTSGYAAAEGACFERYPDDPEGSPEMMQYEIWAPVKKG